MAGSRPSALVYGDVDLNLLDGSAIWLQSVTQALVAAGCAVTLVLKAPVRTDRLVAPLRELPEVAISSPHAERLLPGLTEASLTVPQAITVLATVDAVTPARPRRAARARAGVGRGAARRVRRPALVLPDRRAAGGTRGDAQGRRGPHRHREGVALPAVPDRGAALLPRGLGPRRLRQVGALPAGAARPRHPPGSRTGGGSARHPAAARLHGEVRAPVEHPGDDFPAFAARLARRDRRGAHGRRQGARRPARPHLQPADAGRARRGLPPRRSAGGRRAGKRNARRDLARRAAARRGDAARGRRRRRAVLAASRA